MPDKYLYLLLNGITILFPLLYSFDKRISYYKKWKYLFPSMVITAAIFIIWDIWFTDIGVWGFNPRYLTGITLVNLPIEEWMFFFCIPFSSVFLYEVTDYFKLNFLSLEQARKIVYVMLVSLIVLAIIYIDNYYTAYTFFGLSAFILLLLYLGYKNWGQFLIGYAITLIPFFIINGILTGSGIDEQVVWYNDAENMGVRMFTIPVEDTFYGMLLILMNVFGMEWFNSRSGQNLG